MYDLTGMKFDRLKVIERAGSDKSKNATWLCQCDCGNKVVVVGSNLRCGDTRSCGCLHRENVSVMMSKHKQSKTRLYRVWAGIKTRCYNKKSSNYQYYGAKGITMCETWKDSFEAFRDWAVSNGYDSNATAQECTIDRKDNTKGYSPENCEWANHRTQCNNQSSNKTFTYDGKTLTMAEWAREVGIKYTTLRARIRRGIPFEKAIEQ